MPYVVFGSLCIAAGLATPALPETMSLPAAANVQVRLMLMISGMEDAVHQLLSL